jgi:serine/threonine-protein kinase
VIALATVLVVLGTFLGVLTLGRAGVPTLVGLSQEQAQAKLERAGLRGEVILRNDPSVPAGYVISQRPDGNTTVRRGTAVRLVVSLGPELVGLPDVLGREIADAESVLRARGFTNITRIDAFSADVPKLRVISQSPDAGLSMPKDAEITVTVSKGPEIVAVPDVVGEPQDRARADLSSAGFVAAIAYEETLTKTPGEVLSQSPAPGTKLAKGSKGSVVVAKSPPPVTVPDLRCLTKRQAADALAHAGLAATFDGRGKRVVDQSPASGDRAPRGSTVTVYMGYGSYC